MRAQTRAGLGRSARVLSNLIEGGRAMLVEIKTAHFEGSHTSHDWQPYEIDVAARTSKYVIVRSMSRLIEGRKALSETPFNQLHHPHEGHFYKIRLDQIRGLHDEA